MEMLELQNLHKTFNPGTVNEKVALNGVSLKMDFPVIFDFTCCHCICLILK